MSPVEEVGLTAAVGERFLTPIRMVVHPGSINDRPYELEADLVYKTDVLADQPRITVPKGYRTDFASVPRVFWRLFPPGGAYRGAAVVHDWLCDVDPKACSSKDAAKVFLEAMKDLGLPKVTRWPMYQAVRWFGPRFKREA